MWWMPVKFAPARACVVPCLLRGRGVSVLCLEAIALLGKKAPSWIGVTSLPPHLHHHPRSEIMLPQRSQQEMPEVDAELQGEDTT